MDKKTTLEMIAAISNANGTSGFEDEVVAAIRPYAEGLGEITEDCMRNLYTVSYTHLDVYKRQDVSYDVAIEAVKKIAESGMFE